MLPTMRRSAVLPPQLARSYRAAAGSVCRAVHPVGSRAAVGAGFPHAKRLSNARHHQVRITNWREIDEAHAIGEFTAHIGGDADGQAGFADPPGPVRVSRRRSGRRKCSCTAATACARPISGAGGGRLCCGLVSVRSAGKLAGRSGAITWKMRSGSPRSRRRWTPRLCICVSAGRPRAPDRP